MSVNKVILIGNLGQKPELRSTNGGLSVTKLRIATTDRRKGNDGQWADSTEWHSVVVFGGQAENCSKFLDKGRQVYIEGRLQTRKWQDRDGNDRWTTEVVANSVKFLGGKNQADQGSSYDNSSNYQSSNASSSDYGGGGGGDEIPF